MRMIYLIYYLYTLQIYFLISHKTIIWFSVSEFSFIAVICNRLDYVIPMNNYRFASSFTEHRPI